MFIVCKYELNTYPTVYLVAIFFAFNLAFSALPSDKRFSTNPSPLHRGHSPEPPQSSHVLVGTAYTWFT